MPPEKAKPITLPDGRKGFAIEVGFEPIHEDWNVYELADGTRLRVKTKLARAFQIVDEAGDPIYGEDGEPEYIVNAGLNVQPESQSVAANNEDSNVAEAGITRELQADGSYRWFAMDMRTLSHVEIDPDQAWFWSKDWQDGERRVDEYLANHQFADFDDVDEFFDTRLH